MIDKEKRAHDYAKILLASGHSFDDSEHLAREAWELADAMQAESDKRKGVGVPEAIRERHDFTPAINKGFERASQVEWQPDWSQAPDGYKWWAFDKFNESAYWYKTMPYLSEQSESDGEWDIELIDSSFRAAPSFDYNGDWRDSLRGRPL